MAKKTSKAKAKPKPSKPKAAAKATEPKAAAKATEPKAAAKATEPKAAALAAKSKPSRASTGARRASLAYLDVETVVLEVLNEQPQTPEQVRESIEAERGLDFDQLTVNAGLWSLYEQNMVVRSADGRYSRKTS